MGVGNGILSRDRRHYRDAPVLRKLGQRRACHRTIDAATDHEQRAARLLQQSVQLGNLLRRRTNRICGVALACALRVQRDRLSADLLVLNILGNRNVNCAGPARSGDTKGPPHHFRDLRGRLHQKGRFGDRLEQAGAIELRDDSAAFASERRVAGDQDLGHR